ncbi:MAG: FMN-binding glutamate synthase family protein [Acidobacteria bacterium]|nr:FMN-binding glutamate synthase family protein [Acidobacteriota bacterium]
MKILLILAGIVLLLILWDLFQKKHAILRNFPVIGHFRYLLESVGPELRQYIVTDNDEERPFTRDQRTWVYTSAKKLNNYFGFGTDNALDLANNYTLIKQVTFPYPEPHPGDEAFDPSYTLPAAKVLGGPRGRRRAFRPRSLVNTSAMSFGSLSAPAVEAINRGAALCGCMQNTGEGGVSRHHDHGGELIWQLGTGYFGARDEAGNFDLQRLVEVVERYPVRVLEIKLSQGAKPGHGGILPGAKVTAEIAAIRGVAQGKDCLSPSGHTAFRDADSLLDFVETLADATGLPVGIKSAVGELEFWQQLADLMEDGGRGVDYIAIDGGEGGTGAAPLAFADHVALPFRLGMSRVYPIFAERSLTDRIVFVGSGKLGFPESALVAFGLGCDMIAVAREAMLAVGCIQAQRCHTGHCPTGVATQNRWLMRGLDPTSKAARFANYIVTLRRELLELSRAVGHPHPAFITPNEIEILDGGHHSRELAEVFGYRSGWGLPSAGDLAELRKIMEAGPQRV